MVHLSANQVSKRNLVQDVATSFAAGELAVVFHYHGLTVADVSDLRNKIRQSGAKMVVLKNTLAKLAIADTKFACLDAVLSGPVAFAYGVDPSFVKVLSEFAKSKDKMKVIAGAFNGQLIDQQGVTVLATLPSLDELRARILSVIQGPARGIASSVHAVLGSVARVIKAHADNS